MTRPTPETDALSSDPTIERYRNVPTRVWRKMAELERQRDEAIELLREFCAFCDGGNPRLWVDDIAAHFDKCRAFLVRLEKGRP